MVYTSCVTSCRRTYQENLKTSYCQRQRCAGKPPTLAPHAHNAHTTQKETPHEKESFKHMCTQHPTRENGAFARTSNLVRSS